MVKVQWLPRRQGVQISGGNMTETGAGLTVQALRVRQWLAQWNDIDFDPSQNQARPKEHFYIFSMPASKLRKLAGIYRRSTENVQPRNEDLGIQRRHDPERSQEIRRYVEGGYPWSGLSEAKRKRAENEKLRKPGWLPTAIVVNLLGPGETRQGQSISETQVATVHDSGGDSALIEFPERLDSEQLPPLEVIDGQHRLFAFDDDDQETEDYSLPVVAFHGLDISWQAYLFWTINIKPKKINPSLAFDLYPLLREQDWLESGDVVHVYRESRAQELTEILWSSPTSPWYRRINMLGGARKDNGPVTQAAFIRSLIASMVKSWAPGRSGAGGIFGGTPDTREGLSWSRLQQGAFLLTAWQLLREKVASSESEWALALREDAGELEFPGDVGHESDDAAFTGAYSLLATDQGVRGFQSVVNDLCYMRHRELELSGWRDDTDFSDVSPGNIRRVADTLTLQPVYRFLNDLAECLAEYDWRSSGARSLTASERLSKAALRGSGGYKELRNQLVQHVRSHGSADVAAAADYVNL